MRDISAILREDAKRRNARQAEEDALLSQIMAKNTSRENLEHATMDRKYLRGIGMVCPPAKPGDPYSRKPRTYTYAGVVDSTGTLVRNAYKTNDGTIVKSRKRATRRTLRSNPSTGVPENRKRYIPTNDTARLAPIGNVE